MSMYILPGPFIAVEKSRFVLHYDVMIFSHRPSVVLIASLLLTLYRALWNTVTSERSLSLFHHLPPSMYCLLIDCSQDATITKLFSDDKVVGLELLLFEMHYTICVQWRLINYIGHFFVNESIANLILFWVCVGFLFFFPSLKNHHP